MKKIILQGMVHGFIGDLKALSVATLKKEVIGKNFCP